MKVEIGDILYSYETGKAYEVIEDDGAEYKCIDLDSKAAAYLFTDMVTADRFGINIF